MENFRNWYLKNQDSVSWFLVGLMTGGAIESLSKGQFMWTALYVVLAYINYLGTKLRMQ
jgi:hypothetical protein